MIYSVTFSSIYWVRIGYNADKRDLVASTAKFILEANDEDKFIFCITKTQQDAFDSWVKEYKLNDLIVYKNPYRTTNVVHPKSGRNLLLIVMGKEPIKQGVDYAESSGNCTGKA